MTSFEILNHMIGHQSYEKQVMKSDTKEKIQRKPDWLKIKLPQGSHFKLVNKEIQQGQLHTVCQEAKCPNLGECWGRGTATFMILGDVCTRNCGFCAVKTGFPGKMDVNTSDFSYINQEAENIADAVNHLKLSYVIITSVTRDDLPDGGASAFTRVIHEIRQRNSKCVVEVLIPDFKGRIDHLNMVLDEKPNILGHNVETIPRLYKTVRPQANYQRSLHLLETAKQKGFVTKSGIMVGIGETFQEVVDLMGDLKSVDCDIFTIGQYLQPARSNLPVDRYVTPNEFSEYQEIGKELGFRLIEAGPLVRSSYHAEKAISLL